MIHIVKFGAFGRFALCAIVSLCHFDDSRAFGVYRACCPACCDCCGGGYAAVLSRFTRLSQQYAIEKQAILVETLSGLETVGVTGAWALMKTRYLAALRGQLDTGASSRTCG